RHLPSLSATVSACPPRGGALLRDVRFLLVAVARRISSRLFCRQERYRLGQGQARHGALLPTSSRAHRLRDQGPTQAVAARHSRRLALPTHSSPSLPHP